MTLFKTASRLLVLTALLTAVAACGGSPDYFDDGSRGITVYFPFVEEVILPNAIIAGEPASVTIRVSSEAYPGTLVGRSPDDLKLGYRWWSGEDIAGYLYLIGVPGPGGPARLDYQVELQYSTPGDKTLTLRTVPSRELGGTQGKIYPHDESQDVPVTDTQLVSRRFNLTVLPAE